MARNSAHVVLRVELLDISPGIWRELRVPSLMLLTDLHAVLQVALGWEHRQSYEFRIGDAVVVAPGETRKTPALVEDAARWTVGRVGTGGRLEFHYVYDPSDNWVHRIQIDAAGRSVTSGPPVCLAGEHACPPEDVGGPAGYRLFLAALADERHPDHALYADWIGGIWDPAGFDINAVNRTLRARYVERSRRLVRGL